MSRWTPRAGRWSSGDPVRLALGATVLVRGARERVVDEGHVVADEDVILNGHAFADERVAQILQRRPMRAPFWISTKVPTQAPGARVSVFVRRSARYVVVRGVVLLAVALSVLVTWLFVAVIAQVLPRLTSAALPAGIAAGTASACCSWHGRGGRQPGHAADRPGLLRSAYDARVILEELPSRRRS